MIILCSSIQSDTFGVYEWLLYSTPPHPSPKDFKEYIILHRAQRHMYPRNEKKLQSTASYCLKAKMQLQ